MNNSIFFFFYNLAHKSEFFDKFVIFIADIFPYIVVIFAFIFLFFYRKNFKEIILVFFSGFLAWFVAYVLKFLFHTERPFSIFTNVNPLFSETSYAFPSGHATFFIALAMALFFNHKKIGYVFIIFSLLIGVARIIAGVHFPVDILGGLVLGFTIAFFLKNV